MPKPAMVNDLTKAIGKLTKATDAAAAMEKARAAMGQMTNAAKKAAAEQEKLARSTAKVAVAATKAAAQQKAAADKVTAAAVAASARQVAAAERSATKQKAAADRARDAWENAAARQQKADERAATSFAKKQAQLAHTEATDRASQAADNAASSAAAEAAAIGAVEAVAAAAVVAVTALAAAMAFLAAKAIEVVQQRAGLLATFSALGGGAAAGKATLAMVDKLAEKLPFVRSQIDTWATSLQSAGFKGKALETAIKAVAAAEAIRAGGGAAAEKMLKTLAEGGQGATKMAAAIQKGGAKSNKLLADMGLGAADVTKALKEMGVKGTANVDQVGMAIEKALASKGKDPLTEMGQTWPIILAKLQEGFSSLFEGLGPGVSGFMGAVKDLFGQFNRGSPAMKALKPIVTEVFGAIFKYATMAVTIVSKFVRENLTAKNIGAAWTTVKSAISTVVSVLGRLWSVFKPIITSPFVIKALKTVFVVLAVVIGVVAAALILTTGILVAMGAAVVAVGVVLWGLIAEALDFGGAILAGIMNFDYSAFVTKMYDMAKAGLAAFKSIFSFGSPSKVMAGLGGNIAAGADVGVQGGTGKAVASAGKLGAGMVGSAAKGAGGKGGGGGKGGLTIGEVHLHVAEAGHPAAWAEEAYAAFMERLAASQGL